jgi:hypothetical protein
MYVCVSVWRRTILLLKVEYVIAIIQRENSIVSLDRLHRKKITTGLIELAAVMATDKVYRKAAKASKAFSNFIEENA